MVNNINIQLKIAASLLRKPTYLLLILYLIIGYLIGLSELTNPQLGINDILGLITCCIIIALWYISGTGLNDYADYEIDKINLKGDTDRPLVSGLATKTNLLIVSFICSALALILAASLSFQHLTLTTILLLLNIAYSIKPLQISRRGGLGPLLLPMGYIILPFYLGFFLTNQAVIQENIVVLTIAFYLHFISRIILKDYRDVKGDKANGKLTFLLRHGNRSVCTVSAISSLLSSLLIIMNLSPYMILYKYGVMFLLGFSLMNLFELSKTLKWAQQKPLLSSFGRAMTGISVFTILALCNAIWPIGIGAQLLVTASISIVYAWSSKNAYNYTKSLQES